MIRRRFSGWRIRRAAMIAAAVLGLSASASAHSGPPYPVVSNRVAGSYRLSVWTDPDATDDGSAGGQFWVTIEGARSGAPPPDTQAHVAIRPAGNADWVDAAAKPVDGDRSRQFAALVMDHEGAYGVRVVVTGAWGRAEVTTGVEATYDLRPALKTLFRSKAFYSPKAIGAQVKSPIQLVIGTVRMLGLELPPLPLLQRGLSQMGQVPFNPPNVKGWPTGEAWINSATLFARYNTCVFLTGGNVPGAGPRQRPLSDENPKLRLRAKFKPEAAGTAEQTVDYWVSRLIQRPIDAQKRQVLIDSLGDGAGDEETVRRMVQLVVSMPEYQLC